MQLSNIATAKLSEIKAFCRANNLIPSADLRLKQSWIDAATAFLNAAQAKASEVIATATSPEAVAHYKASTVIAAKFVYKAFIVSCLLAIALGMSAYDTWQSFRNWLESQSLTLNQPVAVVRVIASKSRRRVKNSAIYFHDRANAWVEIQSLRSVRAIAFNAIQPAQEFRNRINAARFVITR